MDFHDALIDAYAGNYDKIIILIRHSEKEEPPEEDMYYDVSLTEKGMALAYDFGKELSHMVDTDDCMLLTSPLKRCVLTAEGISSAFSGKKPCSIEKSNVLGNPGPYVEDESIAGNTFKRLITKKSGANIILMQIERMELPGFRDIEVGSQLLLEYLFKKCKTHVCVAVTHDVIIAALLGFLNGKIKNIKEWIKYLDGAILCIKNEQIYLYTKEISRLEITEKIKMMAYDRK